MSVFSYAISIQESYGMRICVPDPADVERKYKADPTRSFPFWTRLWPSSLALTEFISENQNLFRNKSVLEFGAGIGLPSFVASRYASNVLITDHDAESVKWIAKNIQLLEIGNASVRQLDWTQFADEGADIILLSDVSYDPGSFDELNMLVRHFVNQGSEVVIAIPDRIISGHFISMIRQYEKFSKTVRVEENTVLIACLRS